MFENGYVRFTGEDTRGDASGGLRTFLRTIESDYSSVDFVAEVTVTIVPNQGVPIVGRNIAFLGLGTAESGNFGEPENAGIRLNLYPDNFPFDHRTIDGGAHAVIPHANYGDGTYRVRMAWDACDQTAIVQIDEDYTGGAFVADYTSDPVDRSDNEFNDANSRLYIGGDWNTQFDDFNVVVDDHVCGSATLSVGDASVSEGDSGTTMLSFPVTLSHEVDASVTVDYTTQPGSATAGSDYAAQSGTLTIPANTTEGTIEISVNGDTTVELGETLSVILSNLQAGGHDVTLDGAVPGPPVFLDFSGSGLAEGTAVTNQFAGVTVTGGRIATPGAPEFGFLSAAETDKLLSGQPTSGDFLAPITSSSTFEITFDDVLADLSFYMTDIDAGEKLDIKVFESANQLLAAQTIVAGDPGTGDGIATLIQFPIANIKKLVIQPIGAARYGIDGLSTAQMQSSATGTIINDDFNTPPVANDDATNTDEDSAATFNVLGNDTDAEGDIVASLTAATSSPASGLLTDNGNGSFTFDPNGAFEWLAAGDSTHVSFDYVIEDSHGQTSQATATITINGVNDAPTIDGLASDHENVCDSAADGEVSIARTFSDVDLSDTHNVTVNWGDGSEDGPALATTLASTHIYASGGIYTIIVTVDDGNGGVAVATTTAAVQGVGVVDGTLYIIGTDGRDHVKLKFSEKKDELKGDAKLDQGGSDGGSDGGKDKGKKKRRGGSNGGSDGGSDGGHDHIKQTFAISDVNRVVTYLCDGGDHYDGGSDGGSDGGVDAAIPQFVFGGAGKDHIHGGRGNDVLIGGAGRDDLKGGNGLDILIGGTGRDKLKGGRGDDLLIGGSTDNQDDLGALDEALAAWAGGDEMLALNLLGTVDDDDEKDSLFGEKGHDYLEFGLRDKLKQ